MRGHRLCEGPEKVLLRKLTLPVVLVEGLRKRLSIIKRSDSEQHKLEIWVELNEHLEDVGSEAQVDRHLLILPVLQGLDQSDRRSLQVWVLWEGVCLS